MFFFFFFALSDVGKQSRSETPVTTAACVVLSVRVHVRPVYWQTAPGRSAQYTTRCVLSSFMNHSTLK